ncbi:hypothetical protein JZO70_06775 [Enterococcus sp. 669A]|uniref:HEAT repeat domain-containing protein n=1 Tax=Candidatus Enterococcus moelleringii TaxID=2815325 RepID=A0ABS3L8B9_9ENTE|nr:hypothetical protein [Enterococcus sp. 669A]MBO1305855.1 hypothetical protein [Enterococcus sp. 669A]
MEEEIKEVLASKDTKESLQRFRKLEARCVESKEMYQYWPLYLAGLQGKTSCNRARSFKLLMKTVKWDQQGQIDQHLPVILAILEDEKSIVVRQCVPYLEELLIQRPDLKTIVLEKLASLNLDKYKESMQHLIKRDIESLVNVVKGTSI